MTTGIKPTNFLEDDEEVAFPFLFRRHSRDDNDVVNELVCVICTAVADALIVARRGGLSKEVIQGVVEELCIDLDVESKTVCHGVIDLNIVSTLILLRSFDDNIGLFHPHFLLDHTAYIGYFYRFSYLCLLSMVFLVSQPFSLLPYHLSNSVIGYV